MPYKTIEIAGIMIQSNLVVFMALDVMVASQ